MYFLIIFTILIAAIIIHVISEFKKKAVLTGEANLSLTAKNILPASKTCKICSLITFIAMVLTGSIMLYEGIGTGWSLLSLGEIQWRNIHLLISVLFIILFGLHIYVHWNWIKHMFDNKFKAVM